MQELPSWRWDREEAETFLFDVTDAIPLEPFTEVHHKYAQTYMERDKSMNCESIKYHD
jgi:hypothetical protein